MTRPPIRNAVIGVMNHRLVFVGDELPTTLTRADRRAEHSVANLTDHAPSVVDLGDVAVIPALINTHVHLEFSDLANPLGNPGMRLADWIGWVVRCRSQASPLDAASASRRGIAESIAAGVGGLVDIGSPGWRDRDDGSMSSEVRSLIRQTRSLPLRIQRLSEVIGLDDQRWQTTLNNAEELRCKPLNDQNVAKVAVEDDRFDDDVRFGLSPHAPYSLSRSGLDTVLRLARRTNQVVAMHIAESPDERTLLKTGEGPFADALENLGIEPKPHFPWPSDDPFGDLIDRLSVAPRGLLIHANDLRSDEIDRLAKHPHLSVVYCPRTHAFFGHDPHPIDDMWRRGVRVAIGTDSRASNPDLNLWSELKHVWTHRRDLDPMQILRAATLEGAEAMGWSDMGRIEVGCRADLVAVPVVGDRSESWFDAWMGVDHPVFLPHCNPSGE